MKLLTHYILIVLLISNYACQQQKPTANTNPIVVSSTADSLIVDSVEYDEYIDSTDSYFELNEAILDTTAVGINFKIRTSYSKLKAQIEEQRGHFYNNYILLSDSSEKQLFRDSVARYITKILLNRIFPHWYGTEWDYDGISEKPGEGYIACGYFVSTTLKHIGFNLNRYKYAQQSGMIGAKTLQMGLPIKKFYPKEGIDISKTLVASLKPGLYQVGLSYHVGYLLIRNNEAYFIHSNYLYSGVMLERAADSEAFVSGIYVISDISFNDKLIEKWILNDEIVIIHD